jgi:hypothetical protein
LITQDVLSEFFFLLAAMQQDFDSLAEEFAAAFTAFLSFLLNSLENFSREAYGNFARFRQKSRINSVIFVFS